MMRFIKNILGLSISVLTYKQGDTIVFQTTHKWRLEDLEWMENSLKKHLKTNVMVLQGVELKGVLARADKEEELK